MTGGVGNEAVVGPSAGKMTAQSGFVGKVRRRELCAAL